MTLDAAQWNERLLDSEKHESDYRERAQGVIDKYRDEVTQRGANRKTQIAAARKEPKVQLLWSNTETLKPAMYSSTPLPVVRRRFHQANPFHREASEALERMLKFAIDNGHEDFDKFAEKIIIDYLLPGRSVDRVIFEEPIDGNDEEAIRFHHVPWLWFRYDPQARWEDVDWVAYGDHFFTQEELRERFELSSDELSRIIVSKKRESRDYDDYQVWEIWCKSENSIKWVMEGVDFFLEESEPLVQLSGFFDMPEPLYSIRTNDSLIPIPEYTQYQYQAVEIDNLTERIDRLVNAIRANGFYAGDISDELGSILNAGDGKMVAIPDWAAVVERGGLSGLIDFVPIEQYVKSLQVLVAQRQLLIQQVFDITGISDLLRGSSDPRETAKAQQLKAAFGNRRIRPRQLQVQRYVRDLFRIAGETMAEGYRRESIERIVGASLTEQAFSLLRSDVSRNFAIEIETDSTLAPDEQIEKQQVAEFMGAMANFLPVAQQLAAGGGAQLAGALMLWAMRRFRAGRDVEQAVENAIQAVQQQQAQQPQPDPKLVRVMAEIELRRLEQQQDRSEAEERLLMDLREQLARLELDRNESQAKIRSIERLTDAKIKSEEARRRRLSGNG